MAMDKLGFKNMNDVMGDLFETKDGVDVTFIIHEKEIQAHKWILTSRSAVFKAMLEGPMAPADQRHKISDPKITFEDFQRFLKFLYIDKCEQNLGKSQIKALIHLGCLYDVLILVEKYTDQIKFSFLSSNDTYEYAKMSQEYLPATSKLLQKCAETLAFHYFDTPLAFQKHDGTLEWISSELVMEIIKRRSQDGMISEDSVFKNVFEWAKNECHRKNKRFPTPEDIQEIMLPLMPYFYLSKLHPLTMATIIKTYKLIPDQQLINYLAQHLVETFERPCCGRLFCHRGERGGGGGGGGGGEQADLRSLPPRGGRGRATKHHYHQRKIMGIDENTENWNKENFTTTLKKKVNFHSSAGAQKFEPLPKQFSFKLVATCSQTELLSENPDDPWTKFKKKFIYDDENLSDSDIYNELLELCSWYDPKDDDGDVCDGEDDSDEDIEMIKRNLNSEIKYSSPHQQQAYSNHCNTSLSLRRSSLTHLSLSSLRLNTSTNLISKRRQMDESNNSLCPTSKRAYTPFQSRQKSSSMSLDEAISCAAQNLDVDIPSMFVVSAPSNSTAAPKTVERKNSDFWNELDSVTF